MISRQTSRSRESSPQRYNWPKYDANKGFLILNLPIVFVGVLRIAYDFSDQLIAHFCRWLLWMMVYVNLVKKIICFFFKLLVTIKKGHFL